jgi:predicted kinase
MQPNPHSEPDVAGLGEEHIRLVARRLAQRDRGLARACPPHDTRSQARALADDVAQIRRKRPALDDEQLEDLERIQSDFLSRDSARLIQRGMAGRVRAGLGSPLRLHDLHFSDDTVEVRGPKDEDPYSARDVSVDVASLALDLTRGGRGDLAERLISSFAAATDDFEMYGVIGYYERQCALERALHSPSLAEARSWLLLGLSTRRPPVLPPMLVAVGGLVASGKSTIARLVAENMGAPRIEADRAREHLVDEDGSRTFAPGFENLVYEELARRAEIVLSSGRPVVLDACFPRRRQRDIARRLANERGWPFLFVECRVDPETARARLAERDTASGRGGWTQIYDAVARQWETVEDLPAGERLTLDCARPICESEARILERVPAAPTGHTLP